MEKIQLIREKLIGKLNSPQDKVPILSAVILKLNKKCNLSCSYCYVDPSHSSEEMDIRVIENTLEVVFNSYSYSEEKRLGIYLHGGEPLLSFNLIKNIILLSYQKGWRHKINFYLQTNGTLLKDEILEYINTENILLGISLDGYNEQTNKLRNFPNGRNSFGVIDKNLTLCREKNIDVGVISVITRYNVNNIIGFFTYLKDKKVKSVVINPLVPYGRAVSWDFPLEVFIEQNKKLFKWLKKENSEGNIMIERGLYWLEKKIFTSDRFMCMDNPCGAGINTIGIDVDGTIYICDQFVGDERFRIGHIQEDSIDLPNLLKENFLIKQFRNRTKESISECTNCHLSSFCPIGCPAISFYSRGTIFSNSPMCNFFKEIIPYIIKESYNQN